MTTKKKSPELLLPKNDQAKRRLQDRLKKREVEIENYRREHPAQHPDFKDRVMAQQICEVRILKQLLTSEKVVAWDLSKEIMLERQKKDEGSMQTFGIGWLDAWDAITALAIN